MEKRFSNFAPLFISLCAVCTFLVMGLVLSTMTGCAPKEDIEVSPPSPPSVEQSGQLGDDPSTEQSEHPDDDLSPEQSGQPTNDPDQSTFPEIILSEYSQNVSVPDFLDEDQQLLYRQAIEICERLFGRDTTAVCTWGVDGDVVFHPYEQKEYRLTTYTKASGRYAVWADFDAMIHSVFTDTFWVRRNVHYIDSNGNVRPIFIDIDGDLCFVDNSSGLYYRNENFPDTFELNSKTDDEIIFTVTGYYSAPWSDEAESYKQSERQQKDEWEYKHDFTIKMVRVTNGWRFDEFYSTLADERLACVPYFLDEDQQLLYRQATEIYNMLFGGWTGAVCIGNEDKFPDMEEKIERAGRIYTKATGKYAVWADFDATIHSVFTDTFWLERNSWADLNRCADLKENDSPTFLGIDGALYYIDAAKGCGPLTITAMDTFKLNSKTDDEITFTVTGYYSEVYPQEGETYEDRDQRLKNGWECKQDFTIRMVRVEEDWRFDEFYDTYRDETVSFDAWLNSHQSK